MASFNVNPEYLRFIVRPRPGDLLLIVAEASKHLNTVLRRYTETIVDPFRIIINAALMPQIILCATNMTNVSQDGKETRLRYRLIATDIDGTLLNERHELTPRTRAAVRELQRRNISIVLTTARPARSVRALYHELELSGPFIAYNGALVFDPRRAETLIHRPISTEIATRLLACVRAVSPTLTIGLETPNGWYLDRIDPHLHCGWPDWESRWDTPPNLCVRPPMSSQSRTWRMAGPRQ